MNDCIVCQRIPPKIVFKFTHDILDNRVEKSMIHNISIEMIKCINYADQKNRIFFCGKQHKPILAGLLYLIGFKYGKRITQRLISGQLEWYPTETTIRRSYMQWLQMFPELFPNLESTDAVTISV